MYLQHAQLWITSVGAIINVGTHQRTYLEPERFIIGGTMALHHSNTEPTAQQLWSRTRNYMKDQGYLSPRDTNLVSEVSALGVFDNMIILSVDADSLRSTLENKLHDDINECLSTVSDKPMTFIVKVNTPNNPYTDTANTADSDINRNNAGYKDNGGSGYAELGTETGINPYEPDLSISENIGIDPGLIGNVENPEGTGTSSTFAPRKTKSYTEPYTPAHYGQHASEVLHNEPSAEHKDAPFHDPIYKGGREPQPADNIQNQPHLPKTQISRNAVTHLNPYATFDTFVQGTSNRFAKSAAVIVAEAPGTADYNPLFIYGGSGLGKTHLLNAVGNYVLRQDPKATVRYVTAEEFVNDFVSALAAGARKQAALANFTKKYRNVDVLLLDDIQFFRGTETMEQFFHTFNELTSTGKQIVIASDVAPNNLKGFNERLRTRFNKGLVVDVAPPEKETRLAILRLKVSNSTVPVPNDVLDYIADKITDSVRELEGALTRVTAIATLNDQPVSRTLAEQTLHDFFNSDVEVTPTSIITNVAHHYTLTFDDIVGPSRTKNVAEARQVSMYLIREMTSLSLVDIGEIFGGRDHSTVMHACKKIANEMSKKRALYNNVNEITMYIKQKDSISPVSRN